MKTNIIKNQKLKISLFIVLLIAISFSCGKDDNIEEQMQIAKEEINDVIGNLSYDADELLGVVETGTQNSVRTAGDPNEDADTKNNVTRSCTTTPYNLKTNFEEIAILKPNNGIIWPGALVKIDEALRRGLPTPVTMDRAEMSLRVDLPGIGENGNILVEKPDFNTVDAGIDEALEWWNANAYQEGYVNEASSYSDATTSYSSKQVSMDLGVNIEWASSDVSSQLSYESTSTKRVANMVFKQVFYTVSMVTPPNPSAVFGADITADQIESTFNSSTPPGYIQSVSYGRIIMFRMETTYEATDSQLKAAFNYAAGKSASISADSELKSKAILSSSNITTIVIGGNAEVGAEAVSAKGFGDLSKIIEGENAVYSRNNPGAPISYTVRYLKDNTIAKMGYTTDYEAENCSSSGKKHRTIDFINDSNREFRFGITYKNSLPGSSGGISKAKLDSDPDRGWIYSTVSGEIKEIQPPDGAYDIRVYVELKSGGGDGKDGKYQSTYNHLIGDNTKASNSCHRATTNWLGLDLKIQRVTCQ